MRHLVLIILVFILAGCASRPFYVHRSEGLTELGRVAVLPLENLTTDSLAAERLRRVVIAELLARGVDVIEPGEVTRALLDAGVRNLWSLSIKDLKRLGKELKVQSVIVGSVSSYTMARGVESTYPEVTLHLMLIDTSTGRVLWSAWRTEGGPSFWMRYFGTEGRTLNETAKKVVSEMIETLVEKGES